MIMKSLILSYAFSFKSGCLVNIEHLVERFGLFTIIMLGEQIIVLLFYSEVSTHITYLAAISGGLFVFSIFTIYFDVECAKVFFLLFSFFSFFLTFVLFCSSLP